MGQFIRRRGAPSTERHQRDKDRRAGKSKPGQWAHISNHSAKGIAISIDDERVATREWTAEDETRGYILETARVGNAPLTVEGADKRRRRERFDSLNLTALAVTSSLRKLRDAVGLPNDPDDKDKGND